MASVTDADSTGPREAFERKLLDARESVEDAENTALAAGAVGLLALLGTFVRFLVMSPLTVVALAAFLTTVAYGWLRHQALTAHALALLMTVSTLQCLGLITVFIFLEAWPAFEYASAELYGIEIPGLRLFTETLWDPVTEERFSLVPMI